LKINHGLEAGKKGKYNKLGGWLQRMKLKPHKPLQHIGHNKKLIQNKIRTQSLPFGKLTV
jgi:hypothetical protein